MDGKFVFVLFALQICATTFTSAKPLPRSFNDVTPSTTTRHVSDKPINGVQTAGLPIRDSSPLATTAKLGQTTPIVPTTSVSAGFSNSVGLKTKPYTRLKPTAPISSTKTDSIVDTVTTIIPRITSPKSNCSMRNTTECRGDTDKRPASYGTVLAVTAVTSCLAGIVLGTGVWHIRRRVLLARQRKRLEERRSQIVYNSNPAYHRSSLHDNDKLYSTILSLSDYSPPISKLSNEKDKKDDGKKVTTSFINPVEIMRKFDKNSDAKGRAGNALNVLKLYKEGARNSSQTTVVHT
ncbi:uncharacterized protein LOC118427650 [Branchiostoma floridae]|uniref:Uncharacterized protein LOC118427650 n=1 Tax=Branchiostoma floridae TaxID=7739 RepID=A0A9J7N8D2_BRAFL|nr:uncharacterized protein LOC118427650 [Branchiostoma floridae]